MWFWRITRCCNTIISYNGQFSIVYFFSNAWLPHLLCILFYLYVTWNTPTLTYKYLRKRITQSFLSACINFKKLPFHIYRVTNSSYCHITKELLQAKCHQSIIHGKLNFSKYYIFLKKILMLFKIKSLISWR